MTELDPVAIRKALVNLREDRTPWDDAWTLATADYENSDDDQKVRKYMHDHFRAAYHNDRSRKGRWRVAEQDVSSALTNMARRVPAQRDECRSGDMCGELASYGRRFCEAHSAQLDRIAGLLIDARARANPRNGGNKSLYTHKVNV